MRAFRPGLTRAVTAATLVALTCVSGAALTSPAEVHVNAEFANQASDHDPQVVDIKP